MILYFEWCVGIYLTVIMAMSALSVALSVFVLNCHHRGAMMRRPPRLVRTLSQVTHLLINLQGQQCGKGACFLDQKFNNRLQLSYRKKMNVI